MYSASERLACFWLLLLSKRTGTFRCLGRRLCTTPRRVRVGSSTWYGRQTSLRLTLLASSRIVVKHLVKHD
ncbi:hypothetical protein FB45DRAFT_918796 [Roridomyces roridus]|uniref:Secreted protein n=1 Tax=Roridomyces roridus TaxID=1738132 RepID=A0AAD7BRJ9_9AGAR|nr:hypothetical protein FB45DRAFT_918796 [Roridomyces roridus]